MSMYISLRTLLAMASSPIQLCTVFTDDFRFFESNHALYPTDASAVFGCVADLRKALKAFRECASCELEGGVVVDASQPALLLTSVVGSSVEEASAVEEAASFMTQ